MVTTNSDTAQLNADGKLGTKRTPDSGPETITISLPALRAVILGVIDDGDPLLTSLPWQIDRPMPDMANDARLRFCDKIERRLRGLK